MLRIYAVLASRGLTAPRLPEEGGGSGMSMLNYGLMFEQLPAMVTNFAARPRMHRGAHLCRARPSSASASLRR